MESRETFRLLADQIGSDPDQVEKILTGIGLDEETLSRLNIHDPRGFDRFKNMIKAIGDVAV